MNRPLAPRISSLIDAAHEAHSDKKLQHPKTQAYAMFEWQLQEAATERQEQTRSRRQTEDNLSIIGGRGGGGGGSSNRASLSGGRRVTDNSLGFMATGGGGTGGSLAGSRTSGMGRRASSGLSTNFDAEEGGAPTCNLEVCIVWGT